MTTECLPCEAQSLARRDLQDTVPETDGNQTAEWSGPIGMENQRTGDGRLIETNALRWDTLPVPLRWAMQDFGAHDGAYVVGKIEQIERLSFEDANERLTSTGRDSLPELFQDAIIIWGSGKHDLGSEYGREAFRQADEGLTPGVSMDLDDILVKEDDDKDSFTIKEGRVRAATQVAIPAFEGARISVAKASREVFDATERLEDAEALMGDDTEAFNWVDDVGGLPPYIKRISKHLRKKGMTESHAIATAVNVVKKMCATGDVNFPGAQQVNADSRAEACAAVASWEEKKTRAKASSAETLPGNGRTQVGTAEHYLRVPEDESLVAGATVFDHTRFADPHLTGPTGLTVTEDGHVFGHIALWGTCHIANPQGQKVCTQPPRSYSNYAYFKTGAVQTTAGEVAVGKITMNTLHAGPKLAANDTVYHYEHTGSVGAYVIAGEDQFGIWVAGSARPDADLTALKAAPVSGDWRTIGGNLELVGALSVNVPGFPVPRAQALVASGQIQSLVAGGMVEVAERTHLTDQGELAVNATAEMSDEAVLALRDRFRTMERREKAAALVLQVNRLAALEKIRRVARNVPGTFAFNPDQWRVPKGNGKLSGRFIDMPDNLMEDLGDTLMGAMDLATGSDADVDTKGGQLGEALDKATDAASRASEALKAGDGPGAIAASTELDEHLQKIEAVAMDMADSGMMPETEAEKVGAVLEKAFTGNTAIKDSDLSLLGDELPGAKDGGDIGGGDGGIGAGEDGGIGDPSPAEVNKAKSNKRGDAPEGGTSIDPADLPSNVREALGDSEDDETFFESTKWPGTYEARATVDGEEYVTAVADKDGNVVGTTSGGGNPYMIYTPDGGTGENTYENLNDAVADLPGYDAPDTYGEDPVDAGDAVAEMSDADLLEAIREGTASPAMREEAETRDLLAGEDPADASDAVAEMSDADLLEAIREGTATPAMREEAETRDLLAGEDSGDLPDDVDTQSASDTASLLESKLLDAADSGALDDEDAEQVGESLEQFRDALDQLTAGIQTGNHDPADLAAAQNALSDLEAKMMAAADKPGLTDDQANGLGQTLDDMFDTLSRLSQGIQGSAFSSRKYVRQWLGRRGIRLGSFSLI